MGYANIAWAVDSLPGHNRLYIGDDLHEDGTVLFDLCERNGSSFTCTNITRDAAEQVVAHLTDIFELDVEPSTQSPTTVINIYMSHD